MIPQTTITLTQSELSVLLILTTERLELEQANRIKHMTDNIRQYWLKDCKTALAKIDQAFTHCLVTDAEPKLFHPTKDTEE
jgi:hypothetical protein